MAEAKDRWKELMEERRGLIRGGAKDLDRLAENMEEAIEVAGYLELRWVNKILALKRVEGRKLREPGTYVYVMFSIKTGRMYSGETDVVQFTASGSL